MPNLNKNTINKILFTLGLEKNIENLGKEPEKIKEIDGVNLDHFRAILSTMPKDEVEKILYRKVKEEEE
jgi:hypothetical protein